ncbi:MAG: type II toxin-antitoxin system HigB family toxin [Opitutus sp.]|nr:type II toxin-antitoxin system HigB family toxin [Opitutus sp.]
MRLVPLKRLQEYAVRQPTAAPTLGHWATLMRRHDFDSFAALRRVIPSADQITVASGNPVTIFNIKNHYRLITAIHYNRRAIFILLLLTHHPYDQARWKEHL